MNRFMCKFTGGHQYDDSKQKFELCPDDVRTLYVYNRCVKCGEVRVEIVNTDQLVEQE